MKKSFWNGVIPALTTPFAADGSVDHAFLARHCGMMMGAGCTGIVALGSLGETATLSAAEKKAVLETVVKAVGKRGAVVAGIAALSTGEAVAAAKVAEQAGCAGLMVLPPYVYSSEMARDEAPCRVGDRRDGAALHALQQPDRVQDRLPARAGGRARGGAEEPRGDQGIER